MHVIGGWINTRLQTGPQTCYSVITTYQGHGCILLLFFYTCIYVYLFFCITLVLQIILITLNSSFLEWILPPQGFKRKMSVLLFYCWAKETVHIYTNTSHSHQHTFHTTSIHHLIYTFKCLWQYMTFDMLMCHKSAKTETNLALKMSVLPMTGFHKLFQIGLRMKQI